MKLSELINLVGGLLDDMVVPYRWSNVEFLAYTNDTINELCEKAKILVDSSTEAICKLTLVPGLAKYALDERVIDITGARLVTGDRHITRRTRAYMDNFCAGWDSETASRGTPKNFLGDVDTGYITLVPTPDEADNLHLTVVRFPLEQLSVLNLEATPEIHFKYQYKLTDGIMGRAYLKQDTETYDPKKAERHLALWRQTINTVMLDEINRNDIDNQNDQVPDYLDD